MMTALLQHYQQQARLSTLPWVARLQEAALTDLSEQGFPTRQDEDWKYTALDSLWQHQFIPSSRRDSGLTRPSDLPISQQMTVYNGDLTGLEHLQMQLPKGVILMPLAQAFIEKADLLQSYWPKVPHQHGWQALNTAMLGTGLFIYVPEGVMLESPILISHYQNQANQAVYLRHVIIAEAGSQLRLLEEYAGEAETVYLTSTQTDIVLKAGARVSHCKIQNEGLQAYHLGHVQVSQQANSEFSSHSISIGGKLVRSDLDIELAESHASCLMNGIYLTGDGQHVDHHTAVHHLVPHCQSEQNYKGILTGQSRAVFNGKVVVARDAQHTKANQQNKNMLLARQAEIDTKPQLEIYADDVQCAHGAAVGQLDEDALFYLATRGIDKQQAMGYLLHAFIAENLSLLADEPLAAWVMNCLNQLSGSHDEYTS